MLGMLTGLFLQRSKATAKTALVIFAVGVVFALLGAAWNTVYPINKALWSSSFVLAVAGYSLVMFALFYYIIEVLGWRRWTLFFTVIGMNSITIYLGQKFINFSYTSAKLFGGLVGMMPEASQPFFTSAAYIAVCWLFLYFLYRKRVFLKV